LGDSQGGAGSVNRTRTGGNGTSLRQGIGENRQPTYQVH